MSERFGEVWRDHSPDLWDKMWALHRDSAMTQAMLSAVADSPSILEVGCGHGHFLQALLDRSWDGTYHGFDISEAGVERTLSRGPVQDGFLSGNAADFVGYVAAHGPPDRYAVSICRGVVQHQAHWMPMVMAMLRCAPLAVVGIGYVTKFDDRHVSRWRKVGCYDVEISKQLLEREAKGAGIGIRTELFPNRKRNCTELLATFTAPRPARRA